MTVEPGDTVDTDSNPNQMYFERVSDGPPEGAGDFHPPDLPTEPAVHADLPPAAAAAHTEETPMPIAGMRGWHGFAKAGAPTYLTAPVAVGATSIGVNGTSVLLSSTIFFIDGANSESRAATALRRLVHAEPRRPPPTPTRRTRPSTGSSPPRSAPPRGARHEHRPGST